MNIEKGINRIGTILGVAFGIFLGTSIVTLSYTHGAFSYFENQQKERKSQIFIEFLDRKKANEVTEPTIQNTKEKPIVLYDENIPIVLYDQGDPFFNCIERPIKYKEEFYKECQLPSELLYVYLPTAILPFAVFAISFLFGLCSIKCVAGSLNWVIKGFRE